MRQTRLAATVLGLFAVASVAQADVRSRLSFDQAWLGENDDVVARVVITNAGDKSVQIPRWQLPSAVLDGNLFKVTRDGAEVTYLGRLVKRAAPGPADFVTLQPGQSFRASTELSAAYDMASGGEYVISYRLDMRDALGIEELKSPADRVQSNAVAIYRDAPVRESFDFEADAATPMAGSLSFTNCSTSRKSSITTAVASAKTYSTNAKSYLQARTYSTVGARYTTWFGAKNSSRFNTVKSHYVKIESAFLNQAVVVDCSCTDSGTYAYVYPTQPYKIYVCGAFWSAPTTGTDSKAGTLVHEMSHFNVVAATDDWAYGQSAAKSLAISSPSKAVDNADSHEYFAENTPAQN
jgi:peptidyl-Lys metalloendopeptidase